MFLWDDLKQEIVDRKGRSACPVEGCVEDMPRQTKSFKKTASFQCPQHGLYVSPTTFEYPNETDNMLWKEEADLLLWSKIKQPGVKRESRVARDRSEDAIAWNVMRYLEREQLVREWVRYISNEEPANADVIYWSLCQHTGQAWKPLLDTCPMFGESVRRRSEPDIIVNCPDILIFVEAKFGSGNANGNMEPKRYETGCDGWFKQVFNAETTFQSVAGGCDMYQLMRLWLIGSRIASEQGKRFLLVNLVLQAAEKSIERVFGRHCRQDANRRFCRATWEDICEQIVMGQTESESRDDLLRFFRNKSLGYDLGDEGERERRTLRRAFSI